MNKIPNHIAIIMDGNGRWAENIGKERAYGHKKGAETVRNIVKAAANVGIKYLTLFTFSTENWGRPQNEVNALMKYLTHYFKYEMRSFVDNNIRLNVIGNTSLLPMTLQKLVDHAVADTLCNTGFTLTLAISYGGKEDIVSAIKKIYGDINTGKISLSELSNEIVSNYLSTSNIPDPDLLIRTGGEIRISNFLLWELAYTEFYFTNILWPDFDENELKKAISYYNSRERRYGKTSIQLSNLK